MADSSTHDLSSNTPENNLSTNEDLSELRSLLLGFEQSELDKLHERLNNPNIHAEDISQLLPEAIILRTMRDKQLSEAIVPTVEEAIHLSVTKDLNILSEAIFPVIGPATRKAIATALETTVQSLNQTVEHSLSPQGFKWRLEALQTGKSFAEVVLLRTLLYRVEQVFLIHKKTGLLLQHVVAPNVAAQDADLVSAMLTAIRDFVQDSFSVQTGDSLETLQFGELTIWIEPGPQAILAGIIRGNAPKEFKLVFQEVIEKIHLKYDQKFNSFEGDTAPFEGSTLYLEDCFQAQYQPKKTKPSPVLWILLSSILIALGSWFFFDFTEKQRWTAYLEKLNAQPGMTVVTSEKRRGKYFISGIRDPLAADPIKIMKESNINPKIVISRWEPYLSFYPKFTEIRAKNLLQPPATVSLIVDEKGTLRAEGSAPYQWIIETRKLVRAIPGINKFDEKNLIEMELKELELSETKIEKQLLFFTEGSTQLEPDQEIMIENLIKEVKKLTNAAPYLGKNVQIEILGHANKIGSEQRNMILSQGRADAILSTLVSQGIKKTNLSAVGVGTKEILDKETTQQDRSLNRSVSFKVKITDTSGREITQ
ncbi:OmpA family protein [Trichocoleus sp. ST-U3]|uniref:OmpA family protein n=1 Tax=Coleofasciculus sp. FACHB-542 TaxID=2692787 RepID=UPI001683E89F|nr:OmpA family protein [Coleofasciculus sp. FACHB-542]MBD2087955.1 OmpA family protein [Coleofasciculus sp. FACHB-542]